MIKFRQKIMARRTPEMEFEEAVGIMERSGRVFVVWPDCVAVWVSRKDVQTSYDRWRGKNSQYQRNWRARKRAEETGRPLEEIVYEMEARAARKQARKDPAEKLREYNRDRQRAHRDKVKSDGLGSDSEVAS